MTLHEAVALALFGATRRRLLGAIVRTWLARPIPELDDLPPRGADESLITWACRCDAFIDPDAEAADLAGRAERTLAEARRRGQTAIGLGHPDYPPPLAEIPDPPPVLWLRGAAEMLRWPRMVALVGARAATPGGLVLASHLAGGLAEAGVVVVSGLARGIDSAAHRAALDRGGASIGVLGSSLDRLYPAEHRDLAEALTGQGAVVSEHVPGTPPLPFHFPLRNRIISGLSCAVVVVEATEKSGSLITAMAAAEQGREVMAVPGPVGPGRHRGGHALLRDGATLVEGPDDILAALGWLPEEVRQRRRPAGLEAAVARELGLDPSADDFSADEVAVATGWPMARVNARLAALEIEGRVQRIGGGRFMGSRNRVLT
ncbi:MAG: DNA-protecting protein DprA [Acidobacteria bacterium]|nr:DNA-protecting protein DprA [Acidobacteriota bacterium]